MHLYPYVSAFVVVWVTLGEKCLDNQHCGSCRSHTGACNSDCNSGYYGSKCDLHCSPNCKNHQCKMTNKGIEKCSAGCNPGYYGTRCVVPCHAPVDECTECPGGCENGFCQLEKYCVSNCSGSNFGRACKTCSDNCEECNKITGICEDCPNCLGKNCTEGCKEGCRPGYYKKNCEARCSEHCIQGCDQESGHCTSCRVGWYGPHCDLKCSTGCLDLCTRNGSCVHGCVLGLYGEKCNMTCPSNCFNDHCLRDGSCHACIDGFYGRRCNRICENCDGVCDIDSGTCSKCKQFITGSHCQLDCRRNCSLPACEAFGLCPPDKGHGSSEEKYVPYYAVGAMVVVVVVLTAYFIRRLKRMNFLVYHRVERRRQQPEPYVEAENNLYTQVTHSYYELNEAEMDIDNQRPTLDRAFIVESSFVQKESPDRDPHPNTSISSNAIAQVDPLPTLFPDHDSDQGLNLKIAECNVRGSSSNDKGKRHTPSLYYSQYLSCVPDFFTRQKYPAYRHEITGPINNCEGDNHKIKSQTI